MELENDGENIGSENEMLVCVESERKWRESIFVEWMQGVNFSFDIVVGGEVTASRVFRKDEGSFNV